MTIKGMGRRHQSTLRRPTASSFTWPLAILITLASLAYHAIWFDVTWYRRELYLPESLALLYLPFCLSIAIIGTYAWAGITRRVRLSVACAAALAGMAILTLSCLLTLLWAVVLGDQTHLATTRVDNSTFHVVMRRDDNNRARYLLLACDASGRWCNREEICRARGNYRVSASFAFDNRTSELAVLVDGHEVYRQDSVRGWFPENGLVCDFQPDGTTAPVRYP